MTLVLVLVRGVLYMVVMPPWQHYDEPTHFEYVRLIAERGRLPEESDSDLAMRQEIASSMQAAGFWKGLTTPIIPFWSEQPPGIGISELQHPPLYYTWLALPQLLVHHQSVETQLYLARLGSVLLYVATVAAAYALVAEAFPRRRWLPFAVATFLALLPPFSDLMSSVNNDVGAIAASTFLLWAAVRLVRRGPSIGRVLTALALTGACLVTKTTSGLLAVTVLFAVALSLVPRGRRRWLWVGLAVFGAITLLISFGWGGQASQWYSYDPAAADNREKADTPVGDWVFALSNTPNHPRILFQELPKSRGESLRGQTVTLGAWIRSTGGADGRAFLRLNEGAIKHQIQIPTSTQWQFHAFTTTISVDAPGVAATVAIPESEKANQVLQIDGLVLIVGEMPLDAPPEFETIQARTGQWGGNRFESLLRNGSAEKSQPDLRPWIGNLKLPKHALATLFNSLWDWPRSVWVYGPELSILFQSFWGRFGWNHLAVPEPWFYPLAALTSLGLLGSGLGLVRRLKAGVGKTNRQREVWWVLVAALAAGWGGTLLRLYPVFITDSLFWPVARYAFVAIVPTITVLFLGWLEIMPRSWHRWGAWLGLLGMITLDMVALWGVLLPYYYGWSP